MTLTFLFGLAVIMTSAAPTASGFIAVAPSAPLPSPSAVNDTAIVAAIVNPPRAVAGALVNISATIQNKGDSAQTVEVNASAGSQLVGSTNLALAASESKSVGFDWDTSGLPPDTYPIAIETAALPGETNLADNIWNGSVELLPPGSLTVQVSATPPAADVGTSIGFLCLASGGEDPYRFLWDFKDRGTDTKWWTNKSYSSPGEREVSCTVTDNTSAQVSASLTVAIAPIPTAIATVDRAMASPNTTLRFSALTSGGTGPISYLWGFGDGTTGTSREVSHAYEQPGQYTVSLNVVDSVDGGSSTSLTVSIARLSAIVIPTPTSVKTDEEVFFNAFATGGSGPPYTFQWSFGDGGTATGPTVSHTYTDPGTWTPSVMVTPGGDETTLTVLLRPISVTGPPEVVASGDQLYLQVGLGVAAVLAVAVGSVTAVRRTRRRRRWGPRPR